MGSMAFDVSEQKKRKKTIKFTTDTKLEFLYDSDEVWFNQYKVNNCEIAKLVREGKS